VRCGDPGLLIAPVRRAAVRHRHDGIPAQRVAPVERMLARLLTAGRDGGVADGGHDGGMLPGIVEELVAYNRPRARVRPSS